MNMRNTIVTLLLIVLSVISVQAKKNYRFEYLYKDLAFDMPRIDSPKFPKRTVSITDFGAVGNGVDLCTDAFAKAIDAVASKGGGKVIVPLGVWFTGPIVMKSNVNLHLERGAIILFSPNKDLYPLVETVFEGLDTKRCQSPISGRNLVNVAITGKGAIDGNGHYWRPVKKEKVTENMWKKIIARGGAFKRDTYWMPSEQYVKADAIADMNVLRGLTTDEEFMQYRDFLRPVMVSFIECKNLWLEGVIFQNSPAWNLHPLMCEDVIIENVTVRNPSYSANGDGLDIESCKNTLVVNSSFDVGDDGICVKSGKDEDGRRRGRPTENLIVDNCTVFKGHGGFVVGSEMSGGVRNVQVSNCQFLGTDVGLRFKSKRGRGGVVENIYIKNIGMFDIATETVLFDLYYMGKSAVEMLEDENGIPATPVLPAVDETTPTFRNIFISDIYCKNARRAMYFNGLPENKIDNIQVSNVKITSTLGAEIKESRNIKLSNIDIIAAQGPALKIENSSEIDIVNVSGEIVR